MADVDNLSDLPEAQLIVALDEENALGALGEDVA
jgi:hypothetical protein